MIVTTFLREFATQVRNLCICGSLNPYVSAIVEGLPCDPPEAALGCKMDHSRLRQQRGLLNAVTACEQRQGD